MSTQPVTRRPESREKSTSLKIVSEHEMKPHRAVYEDHDDAPHKAEEGEGPWLVSYADLMTLLMGFFALIASFSKPDIKALEEVKKSASKQFGGAYEEPYKDVADKISRVVQKEIVEKKVSVNRAVDGVSVVLDGTTLYESGSFVPNQEGRDVILKIVNSVRNDIPHLKASVEGHTDNVPIRHPIIASNWELSGIRAARVALILEEQGFTKFQLTTQGWGETRPMVPNQDPEGHDIAENQAKNRRIIVRFFKDL